MLAKYLNTFGNKTLIICTHDDNEACNYSLNGMTIFALPHSYNFFMMELYETLNTSLITSLLSVLKKVDIVHFFSCVRPQSGLSSILLRFISRDKTIFIDWDDWWGRGGLLNEAPFIIRFLGTYIEEKAAIMADAVTVVSEALLNRARGLGINSNKIFYIPNGADVEQIKPISKEEARKKLRLPLDSTIVTHVGATSFIDEIAKFFKKSEKVIFIVIGEFHPIFQRGGYTYKSPNVLYKGKQPYNKTLLYLSASDILLLTAPNRLTDGARWPIRLGDYLAVGRPIISVDVGEIGKVIREGQCGLFAKDNDPADWALKIKVLKERKNEAERMGENGRRLAENKYNWKIIAKLLENAYRSIVEAK
jgi:glycosyltransferase involved in cell wall biosynthesis